jgi:hypothetical protein
MIEKDLPIRATVSDRLAASFTTWTKSGFSRRMIASIAL